MKNEKRYIIDGGAAGAFVNASAWPDNADNSASRQQQQKQNEQQHK